MKNGIPTFSCEAGPEVISGAKMLDRGTSGEVQRLISELKNLGSVRMTEKA